MEKLLTLTSKTQGNLTRGSTYEPHDITLLWEIGAETNLLAKQLDFDRLIVKISDACKKTKRRFDYRLYRYASEVNKFWTKEEYIEVIKRIDTWGKLRELVPVLRLTQAKEPKITKKDIDKVVAECQDQTYKDVRTILKSLRRKCDPVLAELGIDINDLDESLHATNERLVEKLEHNDEIFTKKFRALFDVTFLRNSRMFLASLQKEDVYKRFQKEINAFLGNRLPETDNNLLNQILKIISDLKIIALKKLTRIKLREEHLTDQLGRLSTYMKGLSSEENYKQYLGNKEILNKFLSGLSD